MENQDNETESYYFLDIETGNVKYYDSEIYQIYESNDPGEIEDLPEWQYNMLLSVKNIESDPLRFIPIPKVESYELFKYMEELIFSIENKKIAIQLESALRQRKPFRRFKDVLSIHPDLENQWYTFKDNNLLHEVKIFIESIEHDHIELKIKKKP